MSVKYNSILVALTLVTLFTVWKHMLTYKIRLSDAWALLSIKSSE